MKTCSRRLAVVVLALAAGVVAVSAGAVEFEPITPGSFTIAILPDTQHYSQKYPQIFAAQTQWLVEHKSQYNIQMVLHEGDITNAKTTAEWSVAKAAMDLLNGNPSQGVPAVPYSICAGNHDYSTRDSLFNSNSYFGPTSAYATQPTIGGFFQSGRTDNSYSTFTAGGRDWLVFSVEYGPRDEVINWMAGVVASHPNHYYILNTHAYLYYDGTRYDYDAKPGEQSWNPRASSTYPDANDGQDLWDSLVKLDDHWVFTFNGHVLNDGAGWLASQGNQGNVVHQILANYQMLANGGNGYLRMLEFLPDGDTVKVSTYSPYIEQYYNRMDQHFTFSMTSLAQTPDPYMPIHGASGLRLEVPTSDDDAGSVWSIAGRAANRYALYSPANKADVSILYDGMPTYRGRGVLMTSVAENGRDGHYGTVEVSYDNHFSLGTADVLQIATSWTGTGGECNTNVAAAYFSFDDPWRAAHVDKTGALLGASNVAAANVTRTDTGRYRVTLPSGSTASDGMLFVVGAENEDNVIATAPAAVGTGWDVAIRDNTSPTGFTAFQDKRWSFVFVDYDAPDLIGGRVNADGTLAKQVGSYSFTRESAGVYRLNIADDVTPDDGILLLTLLGAETSGSVTAPADNIISYAADGDDFIIQTRDLNGTTTPALQNAGFVFAFLPYDSALSPARPGDANFDGVVNEQDAAILAENWLKKTGATWWDADFNYDGAVDDLDASILAAHWQYTPGGAAVPEPGNMALAILAIGTLGFVRVRRRSVLR